jgi:hypothetical protein
MLLGATQRCQDMLLCSEQLNYFEYAHHFLMTFSALV